MVLYLRGGEIKLSLSSTFRKCAKLLEDGLIRDFTLTRTTMSEVFTNFAKFQINAAAKGDDESVQDGLVHVRIQQRNGRKTLTSVQVGLHWILFAAFKVMVAFCRVFHRSMI